MIDIYTHIHTYIKIYMRLCKSGLTKNSKQVNISQSTLTGNIALKFSCMLLPSGERENRRKTEIACMEKQQIHFYHDQ